MCGVVGFVDREGSPRGAERTRVVRDMAALVAHRGPDDQGTWVDDNDGVVLGHQRLAVIDPSRTGHQPMVSSSERYVISYNGEIYNFALLRRELGGLGHQFRGRSDTEVLLAAVEQWGLFGALSRLRGMFAFSLFDRHNHKLYLVRDRMGEKPLYYGICSGTLVFASDMRAFSAHPVFDPRLSRVGADLYFRLGYVPSPATLFDQIRKVRAGTVVAFDLRHSLSASEVIYWTPDWTVESGQHKQFGGSLPEAVAELDHLLRDSVRARLVSDVPVGLLLSGGVDSSLVAAIAQSVSVDPLRTFTVVVSDTRHDERDPAATVARCLGTKHNELALEPASLIDAVCELGSWGEPVADPAAIPTYLVSRFARSDVVVALTGEGGDELFGGYGRYAQLRSFWRSSKWLPEGLRACTAGLATAVPTGPSPRRTWRGQLTLLADLLGQPSLDHLYWRSVRHWERPPLADALPGTEGFRLSTMGEGPQHIDNLTRLRYLDLVYSLSDGLLAKVDTATMAASLEGRMPILDESVVDFAFRLPVRFLVTGSGGKQVCRELLARYLPPAIAHRPKKGFGFPLGRWLRGPLREWTEELIDPHRLKEQGLLDAAAVQSSWRAHLEERTDDEFRLWDVLVFQSWISRNRVRLPS